MNKEDFYKNAKFNNDCLEWQKYTNRHGYGYVALNGKNWSIHRLSYYFTYGEIPKGKWILHKCDNRKCIKPEHLYLGDNKQNVKDRMMRGRSAKGENNGQSKLTETQVRSIKRLLSKKWTQCSIAERFGVHQSTIFSIKHNEYWKDIK